MHQANNIKRNSRHDSGMGMPNTIFSTPLVMKHDIYINGHIGPAYEYNDHFQLIRSASPDDVIYLHINSSGGHYDTALQFYRCLAETGATIISSIEGICHSAATFLFLAGDIMEVSSGSSMLIHDYSSCYGVEKGSEQYNRISHEKPFFDEFMQEVYGGFLSEEEITNMTKGIDVWMTDSEIEERGTALLELRAKLAEEEADKQKKESSCCGGSCSPKKSSKKTPKQ